MPIYYRIILYYLRRNFMNKLINKYIKYYSIGLLIIFSLIILSCRTLTVNKKIIEINGDNIEIELTGNNEGIHALYFRIEGKLIGICRIDWGNGELFNQEIIISEEKRTYTYKSDYYANKIIIKIYPEKDCKGEIEILYRFYGYSYDDIIMSL
jgi:hypothetical protein